MNREIKFKGLSFDDIWIFGSYMEIVAEGKTYTWILDIYGNQITVRPETICQYTGLKDKNGVKIFEGDILEDLISFKTYEVKFGTFGLMFKKTGWYCDRDGINQTGVNNDVDSDRNINIKVIGNIIQNKELL